MTNQMVTASISSSSGVISDPLLSDHGVLFFQATYYLVHTNANLSLHTTIFITFTDYLVHMPVYLKICLLIS